jgi:hypothetical protein
MSKQRFQCPACGWLIDSLTQHNSLACLEVMYETIKVGKENERLQSIVTR